MLMQKKLTVPWETVSFIIAPGYLQRDHVQPGTSKAGMEFQTQPFELVGDAHPAPWNRIVKTGGLFS